MHHKTLLVFFFSLFLIFPLPMYGMASGSESIESKEVMQLFETFDKERKIIEGLRIKYNAHASLDELLHYYDSMKLHTHRSILHLLVERPTESDVLEYFLKLNDFKIPLLDSELLFNAIVFNNIKALELLLRCNIDIHSKRVLMGGIETNILLYALSWKPNKQTKNIVHLIINHADGHRLINAYRGSFGVEKVTPLRLTINYYFDKKNKKKEKIRVKEIIDLLLQNGANPYFATSINSAIDCALAHHDLALVHDMQQAYKEFRKKCIDHLTAMLSTRAQKNDETQPGGPFIHDIAYIIACMRFNYW